VDRSSGHERVETRGVDVNSSRPETDRFFVMLLLMILILLLLLDQDHEQDHDQEQEGQRFWSGNRRWRSDNLAIAL
jgi:hypothetical protein